MRAWLKALLERGEALILILLAVVWVCAKLHFFKAHDNSEYLSEHWPFWAAMVALLLSLVLLNRIRTGRFRG